MTAAPPPPSVTLEQPAGERRVPATLIASGSAERLRPGQLVWVYIQVAGGGLFATRFYVAYGPCPVGPGGFWRCPIQVGRKDGNYGAKFRVWAAVVSSSQAYLNSAREALPAGRNFVYDRTKVPPHAPGLPGVTDHLVTRCYRHGRCPAG